jgi:hypothetical protein
MTHLAKKRSYKYSADTPHIEIAALALLHDLDTVWQRLVQAIDIE